jgi:hypothetical protein
VQHRYEEISNSNYPHYSHNGKFPNAEVEIQNDECMHGLIEKDSEIHLTLTFLSYKLEEHSDRVTPNLRVSMVDPHQP